MTTRIHLVSLPHTETTRAYSWCAYTEKVRKFADMMMSLDNYEIILYAGERNEAACTEHVVIFDKIWQSKMFGHYNWSKDVFNEWDSASLCWMEANRRAIEAVSPRARPGDILGIIGGSCQAAIVHALPQLWPVEWGVGYGGVFTPYRVFESYAWQHHLARKEPTDDIRFFDAVIPNSFESRSFPLGKGNGGYYLFIGRLIRRKGPHIAAEATARLGLPLLLAGQGVQKASPGRFEGIDVVVEGPHVSHVGVVGPKRRAELMGGARAVFVPTIYLEPFGGVAVEAMMCGTPVITTDWGAFTETVVQGVTGFRCRTLAEFVEAGRKAGRLDRAAIRTYALSRYSTSVVRHQYDAYFKRLMTLKGEGWYADVEAVVP